MRVAYSLDLRLVDSKSISFRFERERAANFPRQETVAVPDDIVGYYHSVRAIIRDDELTALNPGGQVSSDAGRAFGG
jgi:hypothetical protein